MQASHVTIRDWLNRLRWDEQMATGHWQLGYYDRVLRRDGCVVWERRG